MSITDRLIAAAIDHWLLVVALAVSGYWVFPRMLKQTLMNGGGDIIRGIVRTENAVQTAMYRDEVERIVNTAIRAHEQVEEAKLGQQFAEFRTEITDRFAIPKKSSRPKKKAA